MPNYCDNSLTIYATEETINRIREFVYGEKSEFDFNKVIPMPAHIYTGNIGTEEEELYGMNNWYDWRIRNWGTKWNSDSVIYSNNNFYFETAWSPASPVVAELARKFPEAKFWFQYEEMGMGFCGVEVYQNGMLVYEMQGDIGRNWTLEDSGDMSEDELNNYLIEDERFPMQENGLYVHADIQGKIHIRSYKDGKIYEIIDGTYFDFRPADKKLAYWNEETDYRELPNAAA